ncbi:sucrase ferredoxin [Crocosphaera sp. Alani8]|uniref:sucrase ferredoxin n=1 Tax=Crocosphaera sp. Alani8 TaxID=3038952 RepID=UPI00313D7B0D
MISTKSTQNDCQYCSVISQNNGEDPIGTAGSYDHWLILELKQPWPGNMWVDDEKIQPLTKRLKQLIFRKGIILRPIAIAPDREYSQPGYARLFYYRRSKQLCSSYEKQEFLVPQDQLIPLATAIADSLMRKSNSLETWEPYRQQSSEIREMLVCTHANVDLACGRFGYPVYKKLRSDYTNNPEKPLRVWRSSHFGGHKFAPTLIDLPRGQYWGHLTLESLDTLVHQNGDAEDLRLLYRGWAGMGKFAQIVERELWQQEGWSWFDLPKTAKVIKIKGKGVLPYIYQVLRFIPSRRVNLLLSFLAKKATVSWVRLEFIKDNVIKTYEAKVEISGQVNSTGYSGKDITLRPVNQYCVTHLKDISTN